VALYKGEPKVLDLEIIILIVVLVLLWPAKQQRR
jgi:hypothetical protein